MTDRQINDLAHELFGVYAGGISNKMSIEEIVEIAIRTIKDADGEDIIEDCPFCNSKAEMCGGSKIYVHCSNDLCYAYGLKVFIDSWNRRKK